MRKEQRPRRYVARHWLFLLRPMLRYSLTRDAFVLRRIGDSAGPVLRADRRRHRQSSFVGVERRRARVA
jgi:hypothetical protein